jgi:predicted ester cyclase
MSVEANKSAVRRYFEQVIDGGNPALYGELFVPEAMGHYATADLSIEAAAGALRSFQTCQTEIHHLFGEGDLVSARITHHVTFTPDARFLSRLGTFEVGGKSVSWDAAPIFRFEGDKIAEWWIARDELSVLIQLGEARS